MKQKLPIIFATAISFLFVACQKKQYAYVQQEKVDTYAHAQKTNNKTTSIAASTTENVTIAGSEEIATAIANPVETFTASTEITAPTTALTTPAAVETLKYDEKNIDAAFEKLNKLETYVNANEGTTLEDIKETELVKDVKLDTNSTATLAVDELPLNIPAFWWGCVLGLVGVILVYIITEKDKAQTRMALYGCLTWTGIWLIYLLLVAAAN